MLNQFLLNHVGSMQNFSLLSTFMCCLAESFCCIVYSNTYGFCVYVHYPPASSILPFPLWLVGPCGTIEIVCVAGTLFQIACPLWLQPLCGPKRELKSSKIQSGRMLIL